MGKMNEESSQKINTNNQQEEPFTTGPEPDRRDRRFEKRVLIFLVILVVVGLPFGIWQLGQNIASPLKIKPPANANTNRQVALTNTAPPRIEELRNKDTDQDGLSDYDELYLHKTSPYIADSDSDSISDSAELNLGKDPNCPGEAVCARSTAGGNSNTNTSISSTTDISNLSADELRQIMQDAGASEQELASIPDEDLLQSYRDILASESSGLGNTNTATTANSNQSFDYSNLDYEGLYNMSPDNIRALLIDNGVPADTLSEVDDETLRQIYQQSLNDNFSDTNTNTNTGGQ